MKFQDQTVIVTGAGRGIGRSVATRFGEEGARVALVARTEAELHETAALLKQRNVPCLPLPADITERGAAEDCVARTEKELRVSKSPIV